MTVSELLEDPAALSRYEYLVAKAFVQVNNGKLPTYSRCMKFLLTARGLIRVISI